MFSGDAADSYILHLNLSRSYFNDENICPTVSIYSRIYAHKSNLDLIIVKRSVFTACYWRTVMTSMRRLEALIRCRYRERLVRISIVSACARYSRTNKAGNESILMPVAG